MVKMTYLKELHDEEDNAVISFEGNALDIYELRDYAENLNECCGHCDECEDDCDDDCNTNFVINISPKLDFTNMKKTIDKLVAESKVEDAEQKNDDCCEEKCEEDIVNHPSHYTNHGMECILEMAMLYGFEETMSFCKLNAHKYRKRALDKGGRTDLDKSDWYVNTYKELAIAKEWGETPLQYVCQKLNKSNNN